MTEREADIVFPYKAFKEFNDSSLNNRPVFKKAKLLMSPFLLHLSSQTVTARCCKFFCFSLQYLLQ